MAITVKEAVTGILLREPTRYEEFSEEDKQGYVVLMEKAIAGLQAAARLLLLQTTAPKIIILRELNPNLFLLAAKFYGDVRKWKLIANISELSTPILTGTFTIKIPPDQPIDDIDNPEVIEV